MCNLLLINYVIHVIFNINKWFIFLLYPLFKWYDVLRAPIQLTAIYLDVTKGIKHLVFSILWWINRLGFSPFPLSVSFRLWLPSQSRWEVIIMESPGLICLGTVHLHHSQPYRDTHHYQTRSHTHTACALLLAVYANIISQLYCLNSSSMCACVCRASHAEDRWKAETRTWTEGGAGEAEWYDKHTLLLKTMSECLCYTYNVAHYRMKQYIQC